jgi:hypothetical protein
MLSGEKPITLANGRREPVGEEGPAIGGPVLTEPFPVFDPVILDPVLVP